MSEEHNVKLSIVLLIIFWLGYVPVNVNAQSTGQQKSDVSINVNATVTGSIELTTIRNMNFGQVVPRQQTIDISPTQDPEAGKMVASGIPNARIRVRYIREWNLVSSRSEVPLTFNYRIAGNQVDNQETAELLETDNRDLNFNSDGEYYFWIGGNANIANVQPGNYEGEFTIEIEYI